MARATARSSGERDAIKDLKDMRVMIMRPFFRQSAHRKVSCCRVNISVCRSVCVCWLSVSVGASRANSLNMVYIAWLRTARGEPPGMLTNTNCDATVVVDVGAYR